MDEERALDEALHRSAPAVTPEAVWAALLMARQARGVNAGASPLRRRRPPWHVGAAVGVGAALLTGAVSVTAYQLSVPPFSTTSEGEAQANVPVAVEYENSLGRTVECLAFIRYSDDLDTQQRAAIDDMAADERWQGYGQRVLEDLDIPLADTETQNIAVMDAVNEELWAAAQEAVPELSRDPRASGPRFTGTASSCAGPGGIDGRP